MALQYALNQHENNPMNRKMIIAFTGTDGSGKSTVIDQITPWLEQLNQSGVHYEHLRPNWLPPLSSYSGASNEEATQQVQSPHGKKPSGLLGSLFRLCYYFFDYLFGYWAKIRPIASNGSKICLFDRYYHDIVIDPRRLRISLPNQLIRWLFSVVPSPDLIICLGADPELIYARKPETSLEEVRRQVESLKELSRRDGKAAWVDTGQSIEDTLAQVVGAITGSMQKKNK